MSRFNYLALLNGERQQGAIDAANAPDALRELARRGLTVLALDEAQTEIALLRPWPRRTPPTAALQRQLLDELATLLQGGVVLAEAIPLLESAHAEDALGTRLSAMRRVIRGGASVSAAMRASGLVYPDYAYALIEAGEAAGELGAALAEASAELEEEARARQELVSALVYPAILTLTGVVVVLALLMLVLPRFASLIKAQRLEVPAVSRAVIEAGLFLRQHTLVTFVLLVTTIGLLILWLRRPEVRASVLQNLARWQAVFGWIGEQALGRWAQLLGRLLTRRVPLLKAVQLAQAAVELPSLRQQLSPLSDALKRGDGLAHSLGETGVMPASRIALLTAGERAGQLPHQLDRVGADLRRTARLRQQRALKLIEPLAILIVAAVVGFIMMAVLLAITSLGPSGF